MKIGLKTFMPMVVAGSMMAGACQTKTQKVDQIKLATENCLKQADLDSAEYRKIFNSTNAANDSDKVLQFNELAGNMKFRFNEIDKMLTDEGISSKEYKMENFQLANDVDTSKVYQHFADSWMYKNFFKKIGILTPEIAKKCDDAAEKTRP